MNWEITEKTEEREGWQKGEQEDIWTDGERERLLKATCRPLVSPAAEYLYDSLEREREREPQRYQTSLIIAYMRPNTRVYECRVA